MMEHIGNYYIGATNEEEDVAVSENRYEAETSPQKEDPQFWYKKSFGYSQGGYHPLGEIHTGRREDMFPEFFGEHAHTLQKVRQLQLSYQAKKREIEDRAFYASDWGNVTAFNDPNDAIRVMAYNDIAGTLAMMRSRPPFRPLSFEGAQTQLSSLITESSDGLATALYQEALQEIQLLFREGEEEEQKGMYPVLQPGETCFRCGYEHSGPCSIEE